MTERTDIAELLAAASREINAPQDLQATTDAIVRVARDALPGIDHVGISVGHRDGRVETVAATDAKVRALDQLQYELGEGPCVYALRAERPVVVERAAQDRRWPRFLPRAVAQGLRAQMGLCLYVDDSALGALNLYAFEVETFHPDTEVTAGLFATHAALALGHAQLEDQLNSAIATRTDIGKAIGIVMAQYGVDDARAFQYLVRVSNHGNVKLRDVAAEIVARHNREHPSS